MREDGDDEHVWLLGEIGRICGAEGQNIGMGIGIGIGMWRGNRQGCRERGAEILDRDVGIDRGVDMDI